jgi:hypothetical protein
MVLVLGGCAMDAPDPEPMPTVLETMETAAERVDESEVNGVDVCGLAAALPADDICQHVCDPDALAAQLIADGSKTGNCYQLYCQLSATEHVIAGVCLVP